jgi:hypothetical protein
LSNSINLHRLENWSQEKALHKLMSKFSSSRSDGLLNESTNRIAIGKARATKAERKAEAAKQFFNWLSKGKFSGE